MGGIHSAYGEKRNAQRILSGNPGGKRVVGRHSLRYEVATEVNLSGYYLWIGVVLLTVQSGDMLL
jgi:hypothetical protein